MPTLDGATLMDALARYPRSAAFARVEDDRLYSLPAAFRDGSYLWKDVEWIVRWYCRRPRAPYDRAAEEAFRENAMDAIRDAIAGVFAADDVDDRVETLTALTGVDVPIASAFLQYIDPASFAAIDPRVWGALARAGRLDGSYPDPPDAAEYRAFLRACHGLAVAGDLRPVDVARALWVLDVEREEGRHR